MKITVTAAEPKDNEVAAKLTISQQDVDNAVKGAYKDIANKYSFKGFRRGRTPRPVIDSLIGREAVLAQATNDLLNQAEPLMLEELDIVPVEQPNFGDDPDLAKEGEDYTIDVTIPVRPEVELDSYDAPAINMPPEEATEAEIDQQVKQLLSYHTTVEDVEEDRGVQQGDLVSVDVENKENADSVAGTDRTMDLSSKALPAEFVDALMGMKKGETKDVEWTTSEEKDGETTETKHACTVTLKGIKKQVTPELTDEYTKSTFGFDTVADLRDAVKEEIESDKKTSLPNLKEDRVVVEMGKHVTLETIPENYVNQVLNEIARDFLQQLQRQGMTLDLYLRFRGITSDEFVADLREQAKERARQSLALDALGKHLGVEATEEDVENEFKKAGAKDVKAQMKQFTQQGQMPAVRESIRRTKALNWLVENAPVTIVDEIAEQAAADDNAEDAE